MSRRAPALELTRMSLLHAGDFEVDLEPTGALHYMISSENGDSLYEDVTVRNLSLTDGNWHHLACE